MEVLSPSLRARIWTFESAAATICVSRRNDGALFKWNKNAPSSHAGKRPGHTNPLNRTGGAAALVLPARLNPEGNSRISCARDVLSPSFRARIGTFGSAAATKCVSRRDDGPTHKTHVVHPPGNFTVKLRCTPKWDNPVPPKGFYDFSV
jgi:hypothetical protein